MDQPIGRRKASIFWPLVLIAAGVVFLLDNLNLIPGTIWDLVARFWPILLILINLESLIRGERFFGPIFMIGAAIIFQLSILGYIPWNIWEIIIRFWPVLIIVLGLDILLGRGEKRSVLGMGLGLLLVAAILAGIIWYTGFGPGAAPVRAESMEPIIVPLEGAQKADVTIVAPLAQLNVGSGSAADRLAEGTVSLGKSNSIKQSYQAQGDTGVLSLTTSNITTFAPGINRAGAVWDVKLNEIVPVNLDVSSVFSKTNLNLSALKLDGLKFENIFSSSVFTVPSADIFDGNINTVFSTLTIQIPENVAVSITMDGFLAPTDLPSGYTKSGNQILSPSAITRGAESHINMDSVFATLKIVAIP